MTNFIFTTPLGIVSFIGAALSLIAGIYCVLTIKPTLSDRPSCYYHPDVTEFVYVEQSDFKGSLCEKCHKKRLDKQKEI